MKPKACLVFTIALTAAVVGHASPGGLVDLAAPRPPIAVAPLPGIVGCDTLFALRVAERERLANCDMAIVATGICAGKTANQCQQELHTDPDSLAPPFTTNGALLYSYLPRCADGTDNCAPADYVHCIDGTRPILHADKARDASGAFVESNRWIFYVSGGGSCSGPSCWQRYVAESSRLEMSTCHPDAVNCWTNGLSHSGTRLPAEGMLSPAAVNPFAAYNRVRLNKCAYDGFQGDEFEADLRIDRNGDGKPEQSVRRVFHQGHLVYSAALDYLAGGVTLADGAGPALPPLADAELILLVGNSGGGKAMIMTGDLLRDDLEQNVLAQSDVPVRLVVDAHYLPALENEAAFDTADSAPLPDLNLNGKRDVYDHHFVGIAGQLPDYPAAAPFEQRYSDWTYTDPQGKARTATTAFVGTDLSALDASCLASHPAATSFCLDELHVLLNHVSTPFFLRMDLADNVWIDGPALFGVEHGASYDWPDQAFITRIDKQVRDYLNYHRTESEIALGDDASGDATCLSTNDLKPDCWQRGMWAPIEGGPASHTGLLDAFHFGIDTPSLELSLCEDAAGVVTETRFTMATALQQWLVNDAEIEARPFYDRLGMRERYWVDPRAATCEIELACSNGRDDDGDGLIDGADPDC